MRLALVLCVLIATTAAADPLRAESLERRGAANVFLIAPTTRPRKQPPVDEKGRAALQRTAVLKTGHEKLSALKRETREAGQVSLESLKKTLHDAESKLREKHQGRKIDFEVVIRDGKAIVKPTVR